MSRVEGDGPHEGRTQIGKAIVLIVVTAVIAVLVLHHVGSSGATSAPQTSPSPTTTIAHQSKAKKKTKPAKPLVAPSKVTVQVLNGLLSGSLATNLSNTLKSGSGYKTLPPNNTTSETSTSVIYVVTTGYYREAKALAATLGLANGSITRGVPTSAPIPSGVAAQANLIVVIGTSLQAKAGT